MKLHTKEEVQARMAKLVAKPLCFLRVLRLKRLAAWLAFFPVMLVLLSGCKTPCSDPSSIASVVGGTLITKWQCKNASQVQSDLDAWFANNNMCQAPAGYQGDIADLACPFITQEIRGALANKIPANWQCDSSLVGADAAAAFNSLCQLIPF